MTDINDGTGSGLVSFIDYMGSKGLMNTSTAAAYRAAASKVLKIDGEDWQSIDVRRLDVHEQLARFERLSGANYTPDSLATYKARFARAVEMYLSYLESPSSFKPPVRSRRAQPKPTPNDKPIAKNQGEERIAAPVIPHGHELIEYPFPLTTGDTAYLRLPRNFPTSDVDRLASFIRSLAIDPDPSPSSDEAQ